MIIKNIVTGFVIQTYDTETKKFISQEFVCGANGDECEDESGEPFECEDDEFTSDQPPLHMIQPEAWGKNPAHVGQYEDETSQEHMVLKSLGGFSL